MRDSNALESPCHILSTLIESHDLTGPQRQFSMIGRGDINTLMKRALHCIHLISFGCPHSYNG